MTSPIDLSQYRQLKATGHLPSPTGAALAIIRQTQRDNAKIADIVNAVKGDPAFVGRLIKASNSVQVGAHRPIASIQDALMVLGIPAVRGLALSFSLLSEYRDGKCAEFDYPHFWSHSLVCAVAFQALAARLRAAPPEECFSIGLLSRIGELALATLFPRQYTQLLGEVRRVGVDKQTRLEQEAFVMTHGELSAAMLLDWGLPKIYVDPVYRHECPESAGFVDGSRPYTLTWALVLAHRIADVCLAPESERRAMMPPLFLLGSRLSIEADTLTTLCNKVARDWLDWGALLEVRTSVLPPFEDLCQAPPPPKMMVGDTELPGDEGYRMRVLVVDDDAAIRAVLRALLTNHGHEVYEATNGRRGLEMALEVQPQLMVIDWMMPEMDGIALTRALRETKLGRGIYILILTGLEDEENLVKAFESGVDDFMVKPLKPRVLAARLRGGQRVIKLQDEIERDREDIRRFAAELAVTNRRLQEAALTDALTGFPNRRFAMERLDQEWAAALRSKRPLSCMVVDLDEFKPINDRHGHDVGDAVLKQAALALKSGLRVQDLVARIGGDEFLVICPDTPLSSALACAERIRHSVQAMSVDIGRLHLTTTVSIGVAVQDVGMEDVAMLVKRADQGLYIAKDQGRNRVGTMARTV
jgi:diguanylate cyclase (GGDEF)-like protein